MQQILKNILIFVKYVISLKGWRRLFSLDSLMKIIFIYFVIIAILALIIADFPSKFLDRSGDYKRITLLANQDRMGEFQIFKRTMLGCRNLKDYQCLGIYLPETFMYSTFSRHFFTNAINLLNLVFKPEFNLLTTHIMYLVPDGYNVFYINVPYEMIIGLDKNFHKSFPMLKKADAFLDLNYFATGNKFFLEEANRKNGKQVPIIPGILIVQNTEYQFVEPQNMILSGSLWGANRGSLRLSEALRRFGNEGKLFAYGPGKYLSHLEGGHAGEPKDRDSHLQEDIIPLHKKHGISFVAHNFDHIMGSVPTTRIAESIAAGTITISDHNPFIKKHLGDNILYFDSFKSTDEIYTEISDHIKWVKSHKEEVMAKTKRAHKIFMTNFSTEVQIPQIYEAIIKAKSKS
jgi:hypothetical protein